MHNINWQTVAAITSAFTAVAAVGLSLYAVRRTLWLSALVALEQRFAQINHAKIVDPESWESICNDNQLSKPAKHLVFETFQFYHQAFILYERRAIKASDYSQWHLRLHSDLSLYPAYRQWWSNDQARYHRAWDKGFISRVNEIIKEVEGEAVDQASERNPYELINSVQNGPCVDGEVTSHEMGLAK